MSIATMWVLVFVVSTQDYKSSGAASVVQEFNTKEKCMSAQTLLLNQAIQKDTFVLNTACLPK